MKKLVVAHMIARLNDVVIFDKIDWRGMYSRETLEQPVICQ